MVIEPATHPAPVAREAVEPEAPPLTPAHYRAIHAARLRQKRIERAVGVATFDACCAVLLAVLAAPFMLLSTTAIVVVAVLTVVAFVEFRGRAQLRRLDERGATLLGLNQLGLFTAILLYSLWRIVSEWTQPTSLGPLVAQDPTLGQLDEASVERLVDLATVAIYSLLILGSAAFQGGLAIFFFSRWRFVREHRELTPAWVRRIDQPEPI